MPTPIPMQTSKSNTPNIIGLLQTQHSQHSATPHCMSVTLPTYNKTRC